jgi:A/G-specific adenine glycosylase
MKTICTPRKSVSNNRVIRLRQKLLSWFASEGRQFPWRKAPASPYIQLVVEILLQRTRAETVAAFLPRFLEKYPGWTTLADANLQELSTDLQPIGLWRRRAPALQGLAKELVRRRLTWPKERQELEQIPAVGQYVANAALLFIYGEPYPLMDSSMARLLRRYFVILPEKADIRYDMALHAVANQVLRKGDAVTLNWAMLDIAARYCVPRIPRCSDCPLKRSCAHGRSSAKPSVA